MSLVDRMQKYGISSASVVLIVSLRSRHLIFPMFSILDSVTMWVRALVSRQLLCPSFPGSVYSWLDHHVEF
jgi:hypothetical protein